MPTAQLNGSAIGDWTSFHKQCQEALGFPDFYAATMDAWVDCLSYLRDEESLHQRPTLFGLGSQNILPYGAIFLGRAVPRQHLFRKPGEHRRRVGAE